MNAAQVLALATAIRAGHWQIRGGCCSACLENFPCNVSRLAEYVVTTLSVPCYECTASIPLEEEWPGPSHLASCSLHQE